MMTFFPSDITSVIWGVAIGVIGAFGAGFLKKAGEDFYSWIRNKVNPKSTEKTPPQVVIHVAGGSSPVLSSETPSEVLEPVSIERVSGITLKKIQEAIDNAPPLQRKHVANSYIGIRVEWDAYFKGGSRIGNDMVSVRLTTNLERPLDTIWCEVPFESYRELGVLPEGAKIRVSGEIVEAGSWDIKLKDAHLYIYG
jgi:hypothetical protein